MKTTTTATTTTREALIARIRYLGRQLANELQPEQFAAPLRAELETAREQLALLDSK